MYVPASDLQRSIFYASAFHPGQDVYAIPIAWRVRGGRLDARELAAAGAALVLRHEALRTSFHEIDGRVWQHVGAPWTPTVDQISLASVDHESPEEAVWQWLTYLTGEPLPLADGGLFRLALADLGDEGQVLYIRSHHIVMDGQSVRVLLDDLDRAYRNGPLHPGPVQFRDVIRTQAERSATEASSSLEFWARTLAEVPSDLGFAVPDPPQPSSSVPVEIDADLKHWASQAWGKWRTSWFTVLAAALVAAVHRLTGRDTVSIGLPSSGRADSRHANVIGPCTTMVALSSRCRRSDTFADLVPAVHVRLAEALDHDDVSYESMVGKVRPARAPGSSPFVQVTLLLSSLGQDRRLGPATLSYLPRLSLTSGTMFTATLTVTDDDRQPTLAIAYQGKRIARNDAGRLAREFASCLSHIMTNPGVPIMRG